MMYDGLNRYMDATAKLERNPVNIHQIQPEFGDNQADARRDLPNPYRENKFSGANGARKTFTFPVQLTTSRIGNLTRLILTLAIRDDHSYMHTLCGTAAHHRRTSTGAAIVLKISNRNEGTAACRDTYYTL